MLIVGDLAHGGWSPVQCMKWRAKEVP